MFWVEIWSTCDPSKLIPIEAVAVKGESNLFIWWQNFDSPTVPGFITMCLYIRIYLHIIYTIYEPSIQIGTNPANTGISWNLGVGIFRTSVGSKKNKKCRSKPISLTFFCPWYPQWHHHSRPLLATNLSLCTGLGSPQCPYMRRLSLLMWPAFRRFDACPKLLNTCKQKNHSHCCRMLLPVSNDTTPKNLQMPNPFLLFAQPQLLASYPCLDGSHVLSWPISPWCYWSPK